MTWLVQIARGLVYGLTHARMLAEATQVYRTAVAWGSYPRQVCDCSQLFRFFSSFALLDYFLLLPAETVGKFKSHYGGDVRDHH